jgi:hypothetical protein
MKHIEIHGIYCNPEGLPSIELNLYIWKVKCINFLLTINITYCILYSVADVGL